MRCSTSQARVGVHAGAALLVGAARREDPIGGHARCSPIVSRWPRGTSIVGHSCHDQPRGSRSAVRSTRPEDHHDRESSRGSGWATRRPPSSTTTATRTPRSATSARVPAARFRRSWRSRRPLSRGRAGARTVGPGSPRRAPLAVGLDGSGRRAQRWMVRVPGSTGPEPRARGADGRPRSSCSPPPWRCSLLLAGPVHARRHRAAAPVS